MTTPTQKAPIKKWIPRYTLPGQADLFYINSILTALWREPNGDLPRLGNPEDPLDDLIYLMLTRRGKIRQVQQLFESLRRSIIRKGHTKPDWSSFLRQGIGSMERLFAPLGMGRIRAREIHAALTLIEQCFGGLSLDALRRWSNNRCIEFLCSLPGVSLKRPPALCFTRLTVKSSRPTFTVTGFSPGWECCLRSTAVRTGTRKAQQLLLDGRIPGEWRCSLHVSLVCHGQEICTSGRPQCHRCPIRGFCAEYRERASKQWKADREKPSCVDLFSGAGGPTASVTPFACLATSVQDFAASMPATGGSLPPPGPF